MTGLVSVPMAIEVRRPTKPAESRVRAEPVEQLKAYFAGELRNFDLLLAPEGTPFQLSVWSALSEIPYGETTSYGAVAEKIGRPSASRAEWRSGSESEVSASARAATSA